ncbi:MAG: ACT domain-containing protein [Deltaproteobacteria bacterium]|nr:ACT domain-containing protein [Deltaproteobacteria bacterium]
MRRYALTAVGRDRPGIVAAVTKVLYEHDCNIEDSSMTILEDEFAIILIMSMPGSSRAGPLLSDLKKAEKEMGLTIHLKEIEKERAPKSRQSNYIITLHGADRAGIIYKTASVLSRMGINITDLETTVTGVKDKAYIMVIEVFVPEAADVNELERELNSLSAELGVTIKVKPLEFYEPL